MIRLFVPAVTAFCLLISFGLSFDSNAQQDKTSATTQTPSTMDSMSYALGVLFATNLSNEGLTSVNGDQLKAGFEAALAGEATMTAAEADALVRGEMMKLKEAQGQAIKLEGENFSQRMPNPTESPERNLGCNTSIPSLERAFLRMPMMKSLFTTAAHCSMAKNLTPVSSEESPSPSLSMG